MHDLTIDEAEAWRRGVAEGLRLAAESLDCDCMGRAEVLAVPPNSGRRWEACGQAECCALNAAAIRALPIPDPPPMPDGLCGRGA